MDYFLIYLWTRLDVFQAIFTTAAGIAGVGVPFLCIGYCCTLSPLDKEEEITHSLLKRLIKWFVAICLISLFVAASLPSKKDVLIIYFLPKIAKSEAAIDTMDIINKLPKVLQKQINDYLNTDEVGG